MHAHGRSRTEQVSAGRLALATGGLAAQQRVLSSRAGPRDQLSARS